MSIHLKNASLGFGIKMKLYSKIASTDMTVMTELDNSEYLDKILQGKVGFKSKNALRNFQNQGMMYFSDPSGYVQIRFVGEFNEKDIRTFVQGINREYKKIMNPQSYNVQNMKTYDFYNSHSNIEDEIKNMKKEREKKEQEKIKVQRRLESERKLIKEKERKIRELKEKEEKKERELKKQRLLEKKEKELKKQIKFEEDKLEEIKNRRNSIDVLTEEQKLKELQLQKDKLITDFNVKQTYDKNKLNYDELLEEKIKLKERELEIKAKYETQESDNDLVILENNSNSLIIPSSMVDITIINKIINENYLGFSSRIELEKFQNKGDIKINKNSEGTYDFIFVGDYDENEAEEYVNHITEEYALIIQEKTYLKVLEKIKEKNISLESEIIDNENSIVLTLNI